MIYSKKENNLYFKVWCLVLGWQGWEVKTKKKRRERRFQSFVQIFWQNFLGVIYEENFLISLLFLKSPEWVFSIKYQLDVGNKVTLRPVGTAGVHNRNTDYFKGKESSRDWEIHVLISVLCPFRDWVSSHCSLCLYFKNV